MMLLDTSVLVDVLRDRSGVAAQNLAELVGREEIFISRFSELELLQGAADEQEWSDLTAFIATQDVIDLSPSSWRESARIYFDLRRRGETVRAVIDCCIAQLALERDLTVVHNDRDFETIAGVRPLKHQRLAREHR